MRVNNGGGLPVGDTDDPEVIAQPRGGTPAIVDTPSGLDDAAKALALGRAPVALDTSFFSLFDAF